jgi:hypothetical protein
MTLRQEQSVRTMDWESLDRDSRGCETVQPMRKERQCIKCGRWFYDPIFYPEGLNLAKAELSAK